MSKRKLVPAALHSELAEYSSLIRALRTSNTLDVISHITTQRPGRGDPEELNSDDDQESDELVEDDLNAGLLGEQGYETDAMTDVNFPPSSAYDSRHVSPSQTAGPSYPTDRVLRSDSQKRKRESSSLPRQRKRDAWTRWPLLVDDVHVPEWSFEDEISHLAANTLKLHPRPPLPIVDPEDDNETSADDLRDALDLDGDPSLLPHLTNAASNHLSTILALLVAHTPNRSQSLQNRVEPMGWHGVLDILSSCGDPIIADPKIINSVKSRMDALYEPSEDKSISDVLAAHRMQCSINAKEKLKAQISQPMDALLSLPTASASSTPSSQTRRRSRRNVQKPMPKTQRITRS